VQTQEKKTAIERIAIIAGVWGAVLSTGLAVIALKDRFQEELYCHINIPDDPNHSAQREANIYNGGGSKIAVEEVQVRFYTGPYVYHSYVLLSRQNERLSIEPGSSRTLMFDRDETSLAMNKPIKGPDGTNWVSSHKTGLVYLYVVTARDTRKESEGSQ
jgi:hypothetical protein